jgi:nucleotide-binding universal stress UspA family protein
MNKILVLTDFTETSGYGLDLAVDLAKNTGSTVILMNLIFPASESGFSAMGDINVHNEGEMSRFAVELMKTNHSRLLEEIGRYKNEDVEFLPRIEIVESDKDIEKLLKKYKTDALIIGTDKSRSFSEYFFGSDTEKMIKISDIPVISTRKKIENYYPENIVCALDISEDEKPDLSILKEFSDEFNSKVHVLYVLDYVIIKKRAVASSFQFFYV